MTLISDTFHYRADGTVSSVTRVTRESYTTPSGRDISEDVSSTVALSAVTDALAAAYGANEACHQALEQQIADERAAAETEKEALRAQYDAIIAEKEAALIAALASAE